MAKLTTSERADLPASQFAGPGRSYPIPDAIHARKAIQLAPRGIAAGNITPQQAAAIKAKARSKLSQQRFGQ